MAFMKWSLSGRRPEDQATGYRGAVPSSQPPVEPPHMIPQQWPGRRRQPKQVIVTCHFTATISVTKPSISHGTHARNGTLFWHCALGRATSALIPEVGSVPSVPSVALTYPY